MLKGNIAICVSLMACAAHAASLRAAVSKVDITPAGERIVDRAVNVLKMLGQLADMPDDLKGNVYRP